METVVANLIFFLTISGMVALGLLGYRSEKKAWNKGICRENGLPWKRFDTDSQGGRGYNAGDQYCWISWPGVDGDK